MIDPVLLSHMLHTLTLTGIALVFLAVGVVTGSRVITTLALTLTLYVFSG